MEHERTLDRIPFFDQRSRAYAIRPQLTVPPTVRRRRVWTTRDPLDQGPEGACVGFAWAGELAATPKRHTVTNDGALALYRQARIEDQAMGNRWPAGASVLAGAKAAQRGGRIKRYYWAFGVYDVIDAILGRGPVVLGIPWYATMYDPDPDGLLTVGGGKVGGHAILASGYLPHHEEHGEVIVLTNSWGTAFGIGGHAYIRIGDLDDLLHDGGEACVAIDAKPTMEIL